MDFMIETHVDIVEFRRNPSRLIIGGPTFPGSIMYIIAPTTRGITIHIETCDNNGDNVHKELVGRYKDIDAWIMTEYNHPPSIRKSRVNMKKVNFRKH